MQAFDVSHYPLDPVRPWPGSTTALAGVAAPGSVHAGTVGRALTPGPGGWPSIHPGADGRRHNRCCDRRTLLDRRSFWRC
jgi:hypothetical protein